MVIDVQALTERYNGFAIASPVLAIIGILIAWLIAPNSGPYSQLGLIAALIVWILALASGVVGYRQIRAGGEVQRGKWISLLGILIASLGVVRLFPALR